MSIVPTWMVPTLIVRLAEGTQIHRVVKGFAIQGGDIVHREGPEVGTGLASGRPNPPSIKHIESGLMNKHIVKHIEFRYSAQKPI